MSMQTQADTNRMIDEAVQRLHQRTGYVYVLARRMGCEHYLRPMAQLEMMRRELAEIEEKYKRRP